MVQQIRVCNYVTISALTFILYDIAINMDKEITYIWNYRRNHRNGVRIPNRVKIQRIVIQFLFIFGRYYGLFFLTVVFAGTLSSSLPSRFPQSHVRCTSQQCHRSFHLGSCKIYYYYIILAGAVLYTPACNVVLAMRLEVLYRFHNGGPNPSYRKLLGCLVAGEFLVEFAVCIIMALRTTTEVLSPPSLVPWSGCLLGSNITPSLTLASW
ncbi:hypothetical protein PAXRUDRAFT_658178 [Paxillus rubicundulus Ve08.2h10]|uniref:DUF6533 domain-containing protein n=1 Tax=Paxillus rubicundulus Ve08.2h10 TaxID=930991 RepID=A0A0D0DXB9_9AGAM|nr:hypothetical protein PAXRUDRAFT_658178 [Paxillus rubicundulus Ve08.2h10]